MKVEIKRKVLKALDRLPEHIVRRFWSSVNDLKNFPNTNLDIKKIAEKRYRIRIGNYRALFVLETDK